MAPLLDVVFLLLLFFMLTQQVAEDHALQVDLPESSTAQAMDSDCLRVTLDEAGGLTVRGKIITLQELPVALRNASETEVCVAADRNAHVGVLVAIMDAIREAGMPEIQISTQPSPKNGATPISLAPVKALSYCFRHMLSFRWPLALRGNPVQSRSGPAAVIPT